MPPLTGLREGGGGGAVATNISPLTGLRTAPGEAGNAAAWGRGAQTAWPI
jgi:hypothetical protein